MRLQRLFRFIGTLIAFAACTQDEIPVFQGNHYIQFTTAANDTASVSFFFHPDQERIEFPIPVKLTGRTPITDLPFRIVVDDSATTATAVHYTLPDNPRIRAGRVADTVYLTIHKAPEMDAATFRLALQIAPAEHASPGQWPYTRKVLLLSNLVSRPAWWDAVMESNYLGTFTERKFRTFIKATGISDLEPYDPGVQRDYMLQFKYYLIDMADAGTPVLEDDGKDMLSTVPLIG